ELYVGGGSLAQRIDGIWIEERFGYIIYRVRGTNSNNIFASGPFGNVAHYNGIEWHKYEELTRDSGVMSGIFISGSKVFIVGYTTSNTTLIYIANK
ncbi:MAG: hypothetical protein PHW27_14825, partial [Melioribacteraceae bacterium]|nr:hypothetical protein [Melioribacteraceae bacterium]